MEAPSRGGPQDLPKCPHGSKGCGRFPLAVTMATFFILISMVTIGLGLWLSFTAGETENGKAGEGDEVDDGIDGTEHGDGDGEAVTADEGEENTTGGDDLEGRGEMDGSHQSLILEGLSSDKVAKEFFKVTPNIVAIDVDLQWSSNYPEAFEISIIDGVGNLRWHQMPGTKEGNASTMITVDGVPGTWYLGVSRTLCGCPAEANLRFLVNLEMESRPLPGPSAITYQEAGQSSLEIEMGKPNIDGITRYEFTYGDGTSSGWTDSLKVKKTYTEPGTYIIKARVFYSDGMASSWGPPTTVTVGGVNGQGNEGTAHDDATGQGLEMVLLIMCIAVAFIVRSVVSGKP